MVALGIPNAKRPRDFSSCGEIKTRYGKNDYIKHLNWTERSSHFSTNVVSKPPSQPTIAFTRFGLHLHPIVFGSSALFILSFVLLSLIHPDELQNVFQEIETEIAAKAGWFLVFAVNVFLLFIIRILLSRFGGIRLGGNRAKPDFSYWGWYSMLFSAGMGIGLLFWSVAEPISHFVHPPFGTARTVEAARHAQGLTLLHWGIHAWGIYALVGLALSFFAYNKGLPLSLRSIFYPLVGERIYGSFGNMVDIIATISTLFGVATSLGLGAQQINAGLSYVFALPDTTRTQTFLIGLITAMATLSVVLGLNRGIQRLSQINLGLALILLLLIFSIGPTLHLLDALVQNVGLYTTHIVTYGTWTEAYTQTDWQNNWTIFYWGWWIAWSPFVGTFIARISRGRTIKEFLVSVLLIPTVVTMIWITVFGNSALWVETAQTGAIAKSVQDNVAVSLFVLLEQFPWSALTGALGILVIVIFFVTSSDSASFVIDMITAGGHSNPPVKQRVFWAITEGMVASVLLLGGGLVAFRIAAVSTGLPFAIVLLIACVGLWRGLQEERPLPEG